MTPRVQQTGFAAVAAIFLVVVLASMGAFMVSISNSQQISSAQDVQGTRAYWAARGGLEWGVAKANALLACPTSPTVLTLDGFNVAITCSTSSFSEGGKTVTILGLSALASSGTLGTLTYVERSVSAGLEK
jgi:MSHA biogenesis protein MshP